MQTALRGLGSGRSAAAASAAGVALGSAVGSGIADRTSNIQIAGLTGASIRAQRGQLEASVAAALAGAPAIAAAQGAASGRLFGSSFAEQSRASLVGLRTAFGGAPIIGTTALVGGAIAAASALRSIVTEGATLEARLNELRVVSQATGRDMGRLGDLARELGADVNLPAVSAGDAAASMTELAKAGLDVTNTLAGTRGVLQLGTAANLDFASSAEIVASALNAFRLPGSDASRVADLLAGAANEAQGDIADFGIAMQQAAAAAAQVGVPIETTVAGLTLLAQAGIQGSDAGTSLRTTLLRLVPTSNEAAEVVEALGISVADQAGRLRPLADIFEDYRQALAKLPPVTRQAALTTIFGTDAFRAASVFAERGARGFAQVETAITREGIAAEVAAAKAEGLRGDIGALDSAAETLAATLSNVTNPTIGETVRNLTDLVVAANVAAEKLGDVARTEVAFGIDFGDIAKFPIETLAQGGLAVRGLREGIDLLRESEKAASGETDIFADRIAELRDRLNETAAAGLPTERISQEFIRVQNAASDAARVAAEAIRRPGEEAGNVLAESAASSIRRVGEEFRLAGSEAGIQTGKGFSEGVGKGITAEERRAIDSARRMLENVRREGERQLTASIRSARESLESLADTLADQLAEVIDVGPVGQAIAGLDRQLEALQERTSRRSLSFDLSQAQTDLREAQFAIADVGELTPTQKRSQEEFLAPFREKALDARAALKEFDLTEHRDDLQATLDKQKQLAEEGLARLVERFQDGRISAAQFNDLLVQQLGPALDTLKTKAGQNLGLVITRDFRRQVAALVEQAGALAGFLGRPGTKPGPQVVRPADVQADVQRQIADAQRNLAQTVKDARKEAHTDANRLVAAILSLKPEGPSKQRDPGSGRR